MRQVLRLREPVNSAVEAGKKSKMVKDSLEAKATISIPADSRLRQHLKCLDASQQNLRDLMGLSAVEVVEDAPEGADGTPSAQSEELGVAVTVMRAPGSKCERCWVYSEEVGQSAAHPLLCKRCELVVESLRVPEEEEASVAVAA